MKKNIKFYITGLEQDDIAVLKNQLDNQDSILEDEESNQIYLKIPNSFSHTKFVDFLNEFLLNLSDENIYKLPDSCYFDANNAFIKCTDKKYHLKKKELLFLEMLFDSKCIITYEEMNKKLWNEKKNFTLNSLRLFIRDIKKKLPKNTIINVQGIGYKLTL